MELSKLTYGELIQLFHGTLFQFAIRYMLLFFIVIGIALIVLAISSLISNKGRR